MNKVKKTTFKINLSAGGETIMIRTFAINTEFNKKLIKGTFLNDMCDSLVDSILREFRESDFNMIEGDYIKMNKISHNDISDYVITIQEFNRDLISKTFSVSGFSKEGRRGVNFYSLLESFSKDLRSQLEGSMDSNYNTKLYGYNLELNPFKRKYSNEIRKGISYKKG